MESELRGALLALKRAGIHNFSLIEQVANRERSSVAEITAWLDSVWMAPVEGNAEHLGTATIEIKPETGSLDAKLDEIEKRLAALTGLGEPRIRNIVRDEISAAVRRATRTMPAAGGDLRRG